MSFNTFTIRVDFNDWFFLLSSSYVQLPPRDVMVVRDKRKRLFDVWNGIAAPPQLESRDGIPPLNPSISFFRLFQARNVKRIGKLAAAHVLVIDKVDKA